MSFFKIRYLSRDKAVPVTIDLPDAVEVAVIVSDEGTPPLAIIAGDDRVEVRYDGGEEVIESRDYTDYYNAAAATGIDPPE